MSEDPLVPIMAEEVTHRSKPSNYPHPFAARMTGRTKRVLGDRFGLTRFGVNLTTLEPGSMSALCHAHTQQDEFVYILSGTPTLITDSGATQLRPGMCVGFKAGGEAHHLVNRSGEDVTYLEIGDRTPGDSARYPDDDLKAEQDEDGRWVFLHKDGNPY